MTITAVSLFAGVGGFDLALERYKQMGNAVAVPVVNFIIERMVSHI